MFVGCGCNCTRLDESLDSRSAATPIASSYASSQFSEPPIDTGACSNCKDGVIAKVYEVQWNYTSAFATNKSCCGTYTQQKTYKVYRYSLIPGVPPEQDNDFCVYLSKEKALSGYFGQPCIEPAAAANRVVLSFMDSTTTFGIGVSVKYMEVFNQRFVQSVVNYQFPSGWDWSCLQPVVLTRIPGPRRWSMSRPFMLSPGYGSPCNTVFVSGEDPGIPDTVTVTPVPA